MNADRPTTSHTPDPQPSESTPNAPPHHHSHCLNCGYPQCVPENDRCPECGLLPPEAAAESRRRIRKRETLCSVAAAAVGLAVGLFTSRTVSEGWDHPLYFNTLLPGTLVISAILGRFGPRYPWLHGGLVAAVQLPFIGVGYHGPFAPIGMALFIALVLLHAGAGLAGSTLRRRRAG